MFPKSISTTGFALASILVLAACQQTVGGGGFGGGGGLSLPSGGGGEAVAGVPVALNSSGTDACGAADYKFLEGQPFAHTFDLRLPANSRILGRRQQADATDGGRMTMVVSTGSASMAPFTPNAKIRRVYCG